MMVARTVKEVVMPTGAWVGLLIGVFIGGLILGFVGARKLMKRELKKNPPINENMIRAMFMSMGRKPSEAQIRAVINNMKNSQ